MRQAFYAGFFIPSLKIRHGQIDRGRIFGIVAGQRLQQERAILDAARHRAGVVEGPAERDHAITANPAKGRFKANNIAVGCRGADRSAGVRAQGAVAKAGGQRRA